MILEEIKRLISEYNVNYESKIWINYDQIQLIRKYYEENEYTKTITYVIYLETIKVNLVWTLYKEDGRTHIDVYIDYLYDISC
jgi:ABC-type sulfate transport system substrate-binding protein